MRKKASDLIPGQTFIGEYKKDPEEKGTEKLRHTLYDFFQ
jgi:hypothetical protein